MTSTRYGAIVEPSPPRGAVLVGFGRTGTAAAFFGRTPRFRLEMSVALTTDRKNATDDSSR